MFNTLPLTPRILGYLVATQTVIIICSSYLGSFPVILFGFYTTIGHFVFPFTFLVTCLTVRFFGYNSARKMVLVTVVPVLLSAYIFSTLLNTQSSGTNSEGLETLNIFTIRIIVASCLAYVIGQLMSIAFFKRYREMHQWWAAPLAAICNGALFDTACFYFFAFYRSHDSFMAKYWVDVGLGDFVAKIGIGLLVLMPLYGFVVKRCSQSMHP